VKLLATDQIRAQKLSTLVLSFLLCLQPLFGQNQGQNSGQTPGQNPPSGSNAQANTAVDQLNTYLQQIQAQASAIKAQGDACAKMKCPVCDCAAAARLLQALIDAETILDALHNALIDQESATRAAYNNAYSNSHLTGTKLAQLQDSLAWEEFFHNLGSYLLKIESFLNFAEKIDGGEGLYKMNALDVLNGFTDLGRNMSDLSTLVDNGVAGYGAAYRGGGFGGLTRSGPYGTDRASTSDAQMTLNPWDMKSEYLDLMKVVNGAQSAYDTAIEEGGNGPAAVIKALKDTRNLRTLIARSLKMYSEWKLQSEKQLAKELSADQGTEAAAITNAYQAWQQARDQQLTAADALAAIRQAISAIQACMAKANCGSMTLSRPSLPTFSHYGDALRALQAMLPAVLAALKQSLIVTDKCPPPGTTPQPTPTGGTPGAPPTGGTPGTTPTGGTPGATPTGTLPPPKHVVETTCPKCAGIALELARTLDQIDFVRQEMSRIRGNLEQAQQLEGQAALTQNAIQRISALINEFRNGKTDRNTLQKAGDALFRSLGVGAYAAIDIETLERERLALQNTLRTLQEKIQSLRAEEGQLPGLENENLRLTQKADALKAQLAECERNCQQPQTVKMTQCYNEKYTFDQADLRQSKYPTSTNKAARDSALKKLCDCLKAHPEMMTDELRKLCPEPTPSNPGTRTTTGSSTPNQPNQTNKQTGMRPTQTPNQTVVPADVQTRPSSAQVGGENPPGENPAGGNDTGANNNQPGGNAGNNPNEGAGATPPPPPVNAGGNAPPPISGRPKNYKTPQPATDSTGVTIPYSYTLTICRGDDYVFPIRGQEVDIKGISVDPPNVGAVGFGNAIRIFGRTPGTSNVDADVVPTDGTPPIHIHFSVQVIDCDHRTTMVPSNAPNGNPALPNPATNKPPGANGAGGNDAGANSAADNGNAGDNPPPQPPTANPTPAADDRPPDFRHAQPFTDPNTGAVVPNQYSVTVCEGSNDYVFRASGGEVDATNVKSSSFGPTSDATGVGFGNGIRISGNHVGASTIEADFVRFDGTLAAHVKIIVTVIDCSHHTAVVPDGNPPAANPNSPVDNGGGGNQKSPDGGDDNPNGENPNPPAGGDTGGGFLGVLDEANSSFFGNAPGAPTVQNIVITININTGGAAPDATAPADNSSSLQVLPQRIPTAHNYSNAHGRSRFKLVAYHSGSPSRAPSLERLFGDRNSSKFSLDLASAESLAFSIVASGNLGSKAIEFRVHDPSGKLKGNIALPEGLVLEPLKVGTRNPVNAANGKNILSQQLTAYCLDMAKLPPELGQLYRLAPRAVQEKYKPIKAILQAGAKLAAAGVIHPDSDPAAYADFIRQHALWAELEHWTEQKFTEVFLERTKKNAEHMNVKWTKEMEDTLRRAAPGRWRDIAMVLDEAHKLRGVAGAH